MTPEEMTELVVAARYLVECQGTTAVEDWPRIDRVCTHVTEGLDKLEKYIANLPEFDPYLSRPLTEAEWIEQMLEHKNIDEWYINMQIEYHSSQCNWQMAALFDKLSQAKKARDNDRTKSIPTEEK
jgi:hypothetical protein